jgi:hypothetical protein
VDDTSPSFSYLCVVMKDFTSRHLFVCWRFYCWAWHISDGRMDTVIPQETDWTLFFFSSYTSTLLLCSLRVIYCRDLLYKLG